MKRPAEKLAFRLEHHLNAYALAASAAGVGILAFAQPAEAKIIYTKTNKTIGLNKTLLLDLTNHRHPEFSFYHRYSSIFQRDKLLPASISGGGYDQWEATQSCHSAAALPAGKKVGSGVFRKCHGGKMATVSVNSSGSHYFGQWLNKIDRYLGVKFQLSDAKDHFGWVRFDVRVVRQGILYLKVVLTGYAYETIPNKSIITGKTHGKDVITLEPASLGHLARGASAISTWRKGGSQ